MNRSALLLGFCLLAPALSAAAPRPSVLTVRYNGEMLPVVRVSGTEPYVLVAGKERLVRSTPVYAVEDAKGFSDDFVQAPRGALGGPLHMEMLGDHDSAYVPFGSLSGSTTFQVTLTATKTVKRGFAAVVFYSTGVSSRHPCYVSAPEILVHEIPALPAGQAVKIKFSAGVLPDADVYFIQLFDETGREMLTSGIDHAWQFYAARNRARLDEAVEKYLEKFKGANHDAVPALTPGPIFKPTAVLPTGEITVVLTVEADGTVSAVDAGMVADDSARGSLTEALGGWLFLPKLKAGQPVSTYVRVPLQF